MISARFWSAALCAAFGLLALSISTKATDFRGSQFIGFSNFTTFTRDGEALTSPTITPQIPWNELVVSWNLRGTGQIKVEVVLTDLSSKVYALGLWSMAARHSVTKQSDDFAKVDTDTLVLKKPSRQVQARITLTDAKPSDLTYLAFSFKDTTSKPESLEPNRKAWDKVIEVGTRSQLDYPEGAKIWCSPTCSSMILDHWGKTLNRPELSLTVPDVAKAVHDPNWPGTGNWPFNTAFAGNFPGMRAYISRLTDVSELEDWIQFGIPIATSVSYNRLKGLGTAGSGHLIVCVGFTKTGDIIVNDPGTHLSNVRRTFPRDLFRQAWADSQMTVYIIYPESAKIPPARFQHWEQK